MSVAHHLHNYIVLAIFLLVLTGMRPASVLASSNRISSVIKRTVSALSTSTSNKMQTQEIDPWKEIGGGAVNEKKRLHAANLPPSESHYDPSQVRSHLWHALEGLDRYPNYLSRWNDDDIDQLEKSLELQLNKVRQQRQSVQKRRHGIDKLVEKLLKQDGSGRWSELLKPPSDWNQVKSRILNPVASKTIFGSRMFKKSAPTVEEVMNGQVSVELDVGLLEVLMDEELYDVYSFHLLSKDFCQDVREYVIALAALGQDKEYEDLYVGRRPLDLDTMRLGWVNDLLFHLFMRPISRHLFQSTETLDDLDWRQGYVAGYSAHPAEGKPRNTLVTHTDDSEVTLNICIGEDFEGGALEFRGLRGGDHQGELVGTYEPQLGKAVIHAGRQFHDVTQVTSGDRFALILWARSWQGARAQTCPCCWLNRRNGKDCICGASRN